ncbi:MAG: hypothetical protein PHO48_00550 [Candidatus Gracilibacteria bacterium]|nr:hypothetical protein [Candidatus Gracilibacteria bacterium]
MEFPTKNFNWKELFMDKDKDGKIGKGGKTAKRIARQLLGKHMPTADTKLTTGDRKILFPLLRKIGAARNMGHMSGIGTVSQLGIRLVKAAA